MGIHKIPVRRMTQHGTLSIIPITQPQQSTRFKIHMRAGINISFGKEVFKPSEPRLDFPIQAMSLAILIHFRRPNSRLRDISKIMRIMTFKMRVSTYLRNQLVRFEVLKLLYYVAQQLCYFTLPLSYCVQLQHGCRCATDRY